VPRQASDRGVRCGTWKLRCCDRHCSSAAWCAGPAGPTACLSTALPARQPVLAPHPPASTVSPSCSPAVPRQAQRGGGAADNSTNAVRERCPTAPLAPMMAAPPADPDRQLGTYRVCTPGLPRPRALAARAWEIWSARPVDAGLGHPCWGGWSWPPPLPTFWRCGTPRLTRVYTKPDGGGLRQLPVRIDVAHGGAAGTTPAALSPSI
jgi:hypothetical protein